MAEDRIFIIDGFVWTSAGMSAGIDLVLATVEEDNGAELARSIPQSLCIARHPMS
jgi:transcriptional regulator GlxA family with amidase domain